MWSWPLFPGEDGGTAMSKRVCVLKDVGRGHAVLMGECFQPAEREIHLLLDAGLLAGIENVTAGIAMSPFDANAAKMRMTVAVWSVGYEDKIDPSAVKWEVVDLDDLNPRQLSKSKVGTPETQKPTPALGPKALTGNASQAEPQQAGLPGSNPATIRVKCPQCQTMYTVDAVYAGKKGRCKKCSTKFLLKPPQQTSHHLSADSASMLREVLGMAKEQIAASLPTTPARAEPKTEYKGMNDPRISKIITSLVSQMTISSPGTVAFSRNDTSTAMAEDLGNLHQEFPASAELYYAYAAALQLNLLGERANGVLRECVKRHPNFWVAALTMKRKGLSVWNPFKCPEFIPDTTKTVHRAIDSVLSKALVLVTRCGLVPRAAVFHRDGGDEFDVSLLRQCRIEFITTVSSVSDPQVVAINACIHDNPGDPYRTEILACPFGPWADQYRFAYELFVRQEDFDFVIVDRNGWVKLTRRMVPSPRMKTAHAKLAQMFDVTEGSTISEPMQLGAVRQHISRVDPRTIVY